MSKQQKSILLLVVILFAFILSACQESASAEQINEITFTAQDYSFSGPESIQSGWTRIILENEGPDYHHVQLVRLSEGKTTDDLVAASNESPILPEWAEEIGGPNPPEAGQSSEAIINLEAGNYAIICTVPDRQGIPHIQHGMFKSLTVEEADNTAIEPEADSTIDMADFSFTLSDPIQAGQQTIQVNNTGVQGHEVFLAKLAPERTMEDFLASFSPEADFDAPVWQAQGGISVIEPGATAYFTVDLEPGQYILVCFAPDEETGAPHLMQGMIQQITIE